MLAKNRDALVVPVYRETLDSHERARLQISLKNWTGEVIFFGPSTLRAKNFLELSTGSQYLGFHPNFFADISAYNQFMLSPILYDALGNFRFLLVCQLDAILWRPIHEQEFERFEFDFAGAPWNPGYKVGWNPMSGQLGVGAYRPTRRLLVVGNGGLSLRRVSKFRRATRLIPHNIHSANEDVVFSYFGPFVGLKVASLEVAGNLFSESSARSWQAGDPTPNVRGFHGLYRYNPRLERFLLNQQ